MHFSLLRYAVMKKPCEHYGSPFALNTRRVSKKPSSFFSLRANCDVTSSETLKS
ncbi:unnamed protein product [Chondrus crispus]|uniref:Uncharacterized protein n=1 Tax=Chondrus crispus TaxID=2769 RepID=R7QRB8_CHOCR|nr:unnamed protein product [Chondrus crispus]CDF41022.1 unnamed protein product [Chondrus crispus]|eukprot:XP_005711316.1 unnamed protein product [Chondrus crispus]